MSLKQKRITTYFKSLYCFPPSEYRLKKNPISVAKTQGRKNTKKVLPEHVYRPKRFRSIG